MVSATTSASTIAWVRAKYGIDAAQYADFATLRGDASDGLPGVAGIGEKTAATLLGRFGDMAGIIAAAADPDSDLAPGPRGKIKAAAEYLAVAPTVVAVARDIDLDRTGMDRPVTPRDPDLVANLAERYALESPDARLVEALMRWPAAVVLSCSGGVLVVLPAVLTRPGPRPRRTTGLMELSARGSCTWPGSPSRCRARRSPPPSVGHPRCSVARRGATGRGGYFGRRRCRR